MLKLDEQKVTISSRGREAMLSNILSEEAKDVGCG